MKIDMKECNNIDNNISIIEKNFPEAIKHTAEGKSVDFNVLKQEFNNVIDDETKERYQLTWPGKKQAIIDSNIAITSTLRPQFNKSINYSTTKNVYIEGDNLETLKILQESYLKKIDVIYIDPPYNTGTDMIYNNDFSSEEIEYLEQSGQYDREYKMQSNTQSNGRFHSDWLSMMYSRIKSSRNLLKDDGIFVIAIDHNELFDTGLMCDEIFGEQNRLGIIAVVHKPEGRNQAKFFGPSHEYMIVYAKDNEQAKLQKVVLDEKLALEFSESDEKGNYKLKNFIRLSDGHYSSREEKPAFWYPIYVDISTNKMSLKEFDNSIAVFPITSSGQERTWKTTPETMIERYRNGDILAKKELDKIVIYEKLREDQVIKTHWIDKKYHGFHFGTKILDQLLGIKTFDFPKSVYLMHDILKLTANKNAKILDYFSGSATTAHAVMMLNAEDKGNRNFITVQLPEKCDEASEAYKNGYKTICDIGEERIRRAAKKIKEDTNADIDYGFRVYKVDSSNMKDIFYKPNDINQDQLRLFESNIKEDRTNDDLLTQVILDLGLSLDLNIEEKQINNNDVYYVDGNSLIACFDNNIDINVVDEIAKCNPLKVVFKDESFKLDNDKINLMEKFKKLSPDTEISIL